MGTTADPLTDLLVEDLATRDVAGLDALLRVRPDVLWQPPPTDLRDLAERLDDPAGVAGVLHAATLPALQAAQALQALGGSARAIDLREFLATGDAALDAVLGWLQERAVVRRRADVLLASPALADCFPTPLGLGPPLAVLLADLTGEAVKKALATLGRERPATKAAAHAALTAVLTDPVQVRAITAQAPRPVASWLERLAHGAAEELEDASGRFSAGAYRRQQEAVAWASSRGLVFASWGYEPVMPAEVARALRGEGFRAPFLPGPPVVATSPVAVADVAAESAAAAAAFAAQATEVLDTVVRAGLTALKGGGVGAREIARVARTTSSSEVGTRLALELAAAGGLLAQDGLRVVAAPALTAWRNAEPAARSADLLAAWRGFGGVPTQSREDGKPLPAVRGVPDCGGCRAAREALLEAAAELEPGRATDAAGIGPAAAWRRPISHTEVEGDDVPFASHWREAELLGVVARGALSPLGRLLVTGEDDALLALATEVMPASVDEVLFGSDLTALVPGTPSARVTTLLDACAERESRGAGVVWRLTPGSVRRALDDGMPATELERRLAEVARGELPQPLRYLLGDVGRRHGVLRVRDVVSCVRSDDQALLAQAAADRSLRKLGLQLLAPTVLASGAPAEQTLTALRAAGYLPMPDAPPATPGSASSPAAPASSSGSSASGRSRRRPAATASGAEGAVDVAAVAARLHRAGGRSDPARAQGTEATVRALARHLPPAQARMLAAAVDDGGDVDIDYESSSGAVTQRRVGQLALSGSSLYGWCHLRGGERFFTVSRVLAVSPAS